MTWYWPLPRLFRSQLIWLLPGGIWLITFAEGWAAPDLTDRQPPTTSGLDGSFVAQLTLDVGRRARVGVAAALPPVLLPDAGRSTVP